MQDRERAGPSRIIVDTDVFSFIYRKDARAELYRPHVEDRLAGLSFQTVAELMSGAHYAGWSEARINDLRAEIQRYVVVPYHAPMAEIWGRIVAERRRQGRELQAADGWIAATALWASAPVVTHNRRDFQLIPDLTVISEPDA